MPVTDRVLQTHTTVSESTADRLAASAGGRQTVEVLPPRREKVPATVDRFVKGITEYETTWFGLTNRSPVSVYEIRRSTPDRLRFQFSVPSKRLERKVRTQLVENIPGVGFDPGEDGLPVVDGDSIGGGFLTPGKSDWYPLRTDFEVPPINSVASSLHRHAMPDSRIVIQILFQPTARKTVGNRRWARRARKEAQYLRRERSERLPSQRRSATSRDKSQAAAIEAKVGSSRFKTAIRILVIGAGEATLSRVKEITGGFNIFEDSTSGQYLRTKYVRSLRDARIRSFAEAVRDREFGGWAPPFQTAPDELAALISIPDRDQENIRRAQP